MTTYLVDTNVWLRLVQPEAPQHPLAVDAVAILLGRNEEIFVTAQNLIKFWSVASRPTSANGLGWTVEAVRLELDRMLVQFPLLDDTPAVFVHWLDLISHLLTFNSDDFRQFGEIVIVDPAALALPTRE